MMWLHLAVTLTNRSLSTLCNMKLNISLEFKFCAQLTLRRLHIAHSQLQAYELPTYANCDVATLLLCCGAHILIQMRKHTIYAIKLFTLLAE